MLIKIGTYIDLQYLIKLYEGGMPFEQVARSHYIGETTLRPKFIEAGVKFRSKTENLRFRLAKLGAQGRKALTQNANNALRGTKIPEERVARGARSRALRQDKRRNPFEGKLQAMLEAKGLSPIPQQPIENYNLDLGLAPIAVEVHVSANNPLTDRRLRKRIKKLLELGWPVVYVWITRARLRQVSTDKIIALFNFYCSQPSPPREYWVIRGTGEMVERGSDPYHRP